MIQRYGVDTWFTLGDKDLATHILRTERLRNGESLTSVMADLAEALGIAARILPMTDDPVATKIRTGDGLLDFQEYFVQRRHADDVFAIEFEGIEAARLPDHVASAVEAADLIVLCPSNPFVSIDPIVAVEDMKTRLISASAPVIAVSPIIGGAAVKGPAADMLRSLEHDVSAAGVAHYYRDLIDAIIIDDTDRHLAEKIEAWGIRTFSCNTLMKTDEDRRSLAAFTVESGLRLLGPD